MSDKQTMFPYSDRVIVKQIDVEFKIGSLFVGEIEKESETMYGKVVAVGDGKEADSRFIPIKTKIGDIVVMRSNAPLRINIKGEEYWTINESNLIMNLKDDEVIEKAFTKEGYEFTASGAKILN